MKSSKRIILAGSLASALIAGCTSQIDSTPDPVITDQTTNAGGIYTGTITPDGGGASAPVTAIFDSKQRFAIFSNDMTSLYIGLYNVVSNGISGSPVVYSLSTNAATGSATFQGSFETKSAINASYNFYLASNTTKTPDGTGLIDLPNYQKLTTETPSATKLLNGTWDNHDSHGFATTSFTINGDGTVTSGQSSNNNCGYSGMISTINLAYNVYKVTLSESGCTGTTTGQSLIGLASIFPADANNATARLIMAVGSQTEGRLFVLQPAIP